MAAVFQNSYQHGHNACRAPHFCIRVPECRADELHQSLQGQPLAAVRRDAPDRDQAGQQVEARQDWPPGRLPARPSGTTASDFRPAPAMSAWAQEAVEGDSPRLTDKGARHGSQTRLLDLCQVEDGIAGGVLDAGIGVPNLQCKPRNAHIGGQRCNH